MEFGAYGLMVQGLGSGFDTPMGNSPARVAEAAPGSGVRGSGSGFWVLGLGSGVHGSGVVFKVEGLGLRV